MLEFFINKWRTGFSVRTGHIQAVNLLKEFNHRLVAPKLNRKRGKVFVTDGDVYYIYDVRLNAYVYLNALYEPLIEFIEKHRGTYRLPIKITLESDTAPSGGTTVAFDRHEFKDIETEPLFTWQNEASNLSLKEEWHNIFEVGTGSGKTICSMKYAAKASKRLLIITKSSFITKWTGDIVKGLKLRTGEFLRVGSFDDLMDLFDVALEGGLEANKKDKTDVKVILLSSHTLDNYFTQYIKGNKFKITPYEFIDRLGIGTTIYDETHKLFRMNYWSFMFLNHNRVLDLSATLTPDQNFMKHRYLERLPKEKRFETEYIPYIELFGVYYSWNDFRTVSKLNHKSMYNHIEFEKALLKKSGTLNSYFDMLDKLLQPWYFKIYQPGDKALVLFSMIDMCDKFTNYLKSKYRDKTIVRYVGNDKYELTATADIIVSTRGKSGTAVDYEGLIVNLTTVSIDDTQESLQILGRTRMTTLMKRGINPKIIYPVCRQIYKQNLYYHKRLNKFKGRVISATTMSSDFIIK